MYEPKSDIAGTRGSESEVQAICNVKLATSLGSERKNHIYRYREKSGIHVKYVILQLLLSLINDKYKLTIQFFNNTMMKSITQILISNSNNIII